MRYLIALTLYLGISFQAFSQEYVFNFDEKLYPNYLHFFPETEEAIYFLKANNHSTSYIYKLESFELNKETEEITKRVIPTPLEIDGRMSIFLHKKKYYFLETSTKKNFIQVRSLNVDATEVNADKAFIELGKREKYVTSFHREDAIFILTGLKKEQLFNVYKINITSNEIEKTEIECPETPLFFDLENSRRTVDYRTNFPLFNLTVSNKVYIDNEFLTISIKDILREKEVFYRFNLTDKTYSSKKISIPSKWTKINSTYYNGCIYRMSNAGILSSKKEIFYIDAMKFNEDETFYTYTHEMNNYPFNFQTSSPITQNYPHHKTEKEILRLMKKTAPVIYPEQQGDETIIYIGGVFLPSGGGAPITIPGTTVNTPGGTFSTPSTTYNYGGNWMATNDLDYILFETNLNENGSSQQEEGRKITKQGAPLFKILPRKIEKAKNIYKTKTLDIHRVGDDFHAMYFSRKKKRFHYFKL